MKKQKEGRPQGRAVYKVGPKSSGTPKVARFALMGDKRSQSLENGYVLSEERTKKAVGCYGPVFHALVPGRINLWPIVRAAKKLKAAKGPSYGSVFHALVPGRKSVFVWLLSSIFVLATTLAHLILTTPAHAAINEQLNFQARLLNSAGGLVPDGFYNVQFNIYSGGDGDPSTADEVLEWTGSHMNDNSDGVRVANGYLSAQLGSSVSQVNALSDVDWNDDTLWLSINIGDTGSGASCATEANFNSNCGGDGEMDPFMRLTSVPYAFNANRLDNRDSSQFVQLDPGATPQAVNTANSAIAINQTGAGNVLRLQGGGNDLLTLSNTGNLTVDTDTLYVDAAGNRVGIGTTSPDGKLEIAGNLSQAAWGLNGIQLQATSATFTDTSTASSGTTTNAVFNSFGTPTLAATNASVTTTNAATVYIQGAPTAGSNQTITNAYALWVDAGDVRVDGNLTAGTGNNTIYLGKANNGVIYAKIHDADAQTGNPEFKFSEAGTQRAKFYYDIATNRFVFQNNESNAADAIYIDEHLTVVDDATIQGGDVTIGSATDNGALILHDGSTHTGTLVTAALGQNRTYTLPDDDGTILLDSTIADTAFIQGGNSFGTTAILGTNDAEALQLAVGSVTAVTIADGGAVTFQNETDSTSGLVVMDADGGNPVLNVDTTNERVGIGTNAPATVLHILQDVNNTVTLQVENTNAGSSALAEFSARNDLNTYVSFGVGSSTYGVNAYRDRAFLVGDGAGVSLIAYDASSDLRIFTGGDLGASERLRIDGSGNVTFNDPGNDTDFVIESDTNTSAFFLQGSDGRLGLGTSAPSADLSFGDDADKTINILARTSNAAGRALTVKAGDAGAGGSAFSGGQLNLQGGNAAGTGNANGGNVHLSGGSSTGTGVVGLVVIDTPTFTTATSQNCSTNCNITQANVDANGAVIVNATNPALDVTLPNPTNTTAGRIIYVTAANGSNDFTLVVNGGGTGNEIAMRANTTATMIWNGSDWTAAGASSSTTLQAAYDNTLTSAGGAELVLSAPGGNADGLTIRNNATMPISGGVLEVQTSIGTNLFSVNNLGTELAANGGSETSTTWSTDWTVVGAASVARTTTASEFITGQAAAEVTTGAVANQGIRNNLVSNPPVSTTFTVSFTARLNSGTFTTLQVLYSRDGGSDLEACTNYSTQTLSTTDWTKITCTITTDGTTATNPDLIIRQTDATARTFWIDNLSFVQNDATTEPSHVQIGGGITGGQVTLFTLDRASAPPVADGNQTYLGSMYYDTTSGRIQCYESDGWGACGSPPNNIITLTPEYAGSVLNGTGVGTMTADFCADESGVLQINDTLCADGEAVNYYAWTSPQASFQTYSIYLTFQLPETFRTFIGDDTISLDAYTTDATDADVEYEIFRSTGSTITECGSDELVTTLDDQWQTATHNGDEATGCSFAGGDRVIFKLNMTARNNDTVYVSDINFTYTNE